MKRSTKIIISALVVLAIALAPVMFFFGNPLSYLLISVRGNAYLAENYPDSDVEISDISYDPRLGWSAMAASPTSRDTWFSVFIDGWGNVEGDAYSLVESRSTTAERIAKDYRELAEPILENVPLSSSISFADMTFMGGREYYTVVGPDGETLNYTMEKDYGLNIGGLELDADYDAAGLGAMHGRVTIYIHDEEVTVERAAEVLLELKYYFVEAGLPFRGIHLTLCELLNENGQMVGEQIVLKDFLYEDIYEEKLVERVRANWETVQTHFAQMDGTIKEEPVETAPVLVCPDETTAPAVQDFSEYAALLDFSADPNWLARAVGCTFARPEEIDLNYMFYLGVEHPGSWDDISPESRQSLIDQGFWPEFDLQIMPAEKLEEALQSALGIGLEDATIPEEWGYIEAEDAYCSNHSDAYIPEQFTIAEVRESPDGTVELHYYLESYYNTSIDDFLYSVNMILTLREMEDGYRAVSNVPVDLSEFDALYDRELIDIISTEDALAAWAASEDPGSEEALANLASLSPAFAELMTRASALDTFAWYGPERIAELKTDPETVQNAEHLALLIVSVRAP